MKNYQKVLGVLTVIAAMPLMAQTTIKVILNSIGIKLRRNDE
ncbi:hypothetical protein KAB08_02945 [Acinetobacter baumannii]|nr:hypothetical protein KAB08_02945 [Acinetobacter baumannii]